jgi:hypothetical protein
MNVVNTTKPNLLLGSASDNGKMEASVVEALDAWDKVLAEKEELKEQRTKLEKYVALIEKGE